MTRRAVLGHVANGTIDVRISRPGVDAYTADPANRYAVSFSAQRARNAQVASAGSVGFLNGWVYFPQGFLVEPPLLYAQIRGGGAIMDDDTTATGSGGAYQNGTPFCAVVSTIGIAFTTPMSFAWGLPGGDKFTFMAVQP